MSMHTGLVVQMSDGPLFLISDVHAGALNPDSDQDAKRNLIELLKIVDHHNGRLIILGDLFDYWQESGNKTPRQLQGWVSLLADHVHKENPIFLITGNHDHWAGPALEDLGLVIVHDHIMVTSDGGQWLLIHGDGLPEEGLRLVRRGLNRRFRNPAFNALFRLLPFEARVSLMRAFSNYRKQRNVDRKEHRRIHDHLLKWLISSDFRGLVYGHTHEKDIRNIDGKYLVNTGTFFNGATVMVLDGQLPILTNVDELKSTLSAKLTYISHDGTRR